MRPYNSSPKHLGEDVHKSPKRARRNRLVMLLSRLHLWFECTFGLTLMEPWERMLVLTFFGIISLLVCTGLVRYFPQKLAGLQGRITYYLWGHADDFADHIPNTSQARMQRGTSPRHHVLTNLAPDARTSYVTMFFILGVYLIFSLPHLLSAVAGCPVDRKCL